MADNPIMSDNTEIRFKSLKSRVFFSLIVDRLAYLNNHGRLIDKLSLTGKISDSRNNISVGANSSEQLILLTELKKILIEGTETLDDQMNRWIGLHPVKKE